MHNFAREWQSHWHKNLSPHIRYVATIPCESLRHKSNTFHTILALCTCLYWSHLGQPVLTKQTKHSRKSEAQNLFLKCPPFTQMPKPSAIAQWRSCLNACVHVNGGHIEHKFWASDFLLCFVCFIDTDFRKCDRYKHEHSANIGVKCVTFMSETFTRYGSNITNMWQ